MSDAGKAAQSAREVVAKHLEALEEWFSPDSPEEVERNVERRKEARDVCRTALALRALLAQPPSDTVARLVEAAEAAVRTVVGWRRKIEQENREVSDVVKPLGSESIMDAIKRTVAERDEARKERDAAFARRDEAAASLSRSDGLLRIAERERDEARKQRDEARWERDQSRWVGRSAAACVERDNGTQPSPAPLDPRALAIYEGAVRVWAAIPRANGFSVTDQVFEAAEILRAAESEARKGVGR